MRRRLVRCDAFPPSLCISPLLSLLLSLLLVTPAAADSSRSEAALLCDKGFPSWGSLQFGSGPFNITLDPPLEVGNAYYPERAYRITLSTNDGSKFEAFHITPMDEKTGRVWPNATSVIPGPECPGKARGIVEGFIKPEGVEKAQEIGTVSGWWRAPPRRSGAVSMRWMGILPRESEFSADAKSARFFVGALVMPEFDPGCVRFEQLPWMGSNASSSFASGFPYEIQPYQSAKLELLNNFEVRVQNVETTNINSLHLKGAGTLTIAENSSLRIGDYLSECFDSGEFVPRWASESPIKNITYFSANLEWMPALLRAEASMVGEKYRVSVWEGKITGEAVIVGRLKSFAFTKSNETSIRIMGLKGNTSYVVTVGGVGQVSTGAESVPMQFRTASAPEPPPFNPCHEKVQLVWLDESGGMATDGGTTRDNTWESGFDELPTEDQSVRIELLSSSRVLVDKMNTTMGSLEQTSGWIVVSSNASLHLKDEFEVCYKPHPAHALRRPSQVNASNMTWEGFTVAWARPKIWRNDEQTPAAYLVRVRHIGSIHPSSALGGGGENAPGNPTVAGNTSYFNLPGSAEQYRVSTFAPGSILSVVVFAESLTARSQGSFPIVVTIPLRPPPPFLKCHKLPQLSWMDPTAEAGKHLSWRSGWVGSVKPTLEQSVLVDLLGHDQVLEIESNVSIGSLHLWSPGSRGKNAKVVVKNTSLLRLGAALDECYTIDSAAAPSNLTAVNITHAGFALMWSPPSYSVTRYSVTIRAAETGRLIRRNITEGSDPQIYLVGLKPMSIVSLTINAESSTTRSVDSFPPLIVLIPPVPIPPPKTCDSNSIATWAGKEAVTSWSSGFSVEPGSSQGIKVNPLGSTIVTVENSTTIGSLQMFAASSGSTQRLVVANHSLLTITSFLDHCFADTASAPTNMTHTAPVWTPATKNKIGTYSSTLSWRPPSSTGGSNVAEYVLEIREWPTSVRGEMPFYQSSNSLAVWQELKTSNTSLVVHDLKGSNTYFVVIVANSQFGQGSFSEPYSMTMPDPIPDCGLRSVWGRSDSVVDRWQQEAEKDGDEEAVHLSFDNLANWGGTEPGFKNGAEVIPTAEGIDKFAIFVNGKTEVSELVLGVEAPSHLVEFIIPKATYLNLTGYSHCIFTRPKPPGQPQNITLHDRSARMTFLAPIKGTHTAELETYYIDVLRVFQETDMVDGFLQSEIKVVPVAQVSINLTSAEDIKRGNLVIDGDQVTYSVHDLLPFSEYKFRVSAANRQGKGFPGAESILVRTKMGAPPPPGIPNKVDETATTVIIQWDSPPAIGAPPRDESRSALQTYDVEYQLCLEYDDGETSQNTSTLVYTCEKWGDSTSVEKILNKEDSDAEPLPAESIRGLSAGVPYRFRVCASNWFEDMKHVGPWSTWSKVIALKGQPPERVSTLLASNREPGRFRLRWDLPANNGIPISYSKIVWCHCTDASNCDVSLVQCNVTATAAQNYGCASEDALLINRTTEGGIDQQESSNLKSISSGTEYAFFVCSCNTEGCGETSRPLFDGVEARTGDPGLVASPAVILLSEPSDDASADGSASSKTWISVGIVGVDAGKGPLSDVSVSYEFLCKSTPCTSLDAGLGLTTQNDATWRLNNDTESFELELSALKDLIEEKDQETVLIKFTATCDDDKYNGKEAEITVTITDNDVADVFFVLFVDNGEDYQLRVLPLAVPEGESADFGVILTSRPTAMVEIDLEKHLTNHMEFIGMPVPNLTLSPSRVQFNSSDWNVAKRITARVEEDDWALPNAQFNISLRVQSTDEYYDAPKIAWERDDATTLAIPDSPNNDVSGFMTTTTLVTLQEKDDTVYASVGVFLTSAPTGDHIVKIGVSLEAKIDGRRQDKPRLKLPGSSASLPFGTEGTIIFDANNWGAVQELTLELEDDQGKPYPVSDYIVRFVLKTTDPTYDTPAVKKPKIVNVKVFDKDKASAGWDVKPDATINLYEEDVAHKEWEVQLRGAPPQNGTVTITMDLDTAGEEGELKLRRKFEAEFKAEMNMTGGWHPVTFPVNMSFNSDNWLSSLSTVRLTAKQDQEDEDPMDIAFRFVCNQACDLGDFQKCASKSAGEGGQFNIATGEGNFTDGCLTPRREQIRTARVLDNDEADIKLKMKTGQGFAETELQIVSLAVSEGSTGMFGAVLTSRPTQPVDVYFGVVLNMNNRPPMEPHVVLEPEFITFNTTTGAPDGWNTPQAVRVEVINDNYALNTSQFNVKVVRIETKDIIYGAKYEDGNPKYNSSYVMLEVGDNDRAGVSVDTSTISLEEKNGEFEKKPFFVKLRSQPLPGEIATVKIKGKIPQRVHLSFDGSDCNASAARDADDGSVTGANGTAHAGFVPGTNEKNRTAHVPGPKGSVQSTPKSEKSLTFSNETWDTQQEVTVCLADDEISWPTEQFDIELSIYSQDPSLFHASVAKLTVSVFDTDTETRTRVELAFPINVGNLDQNVDINIKQKLKDFCHGIENDDIIIEVSDTPRKDGDWMCNVEIVLGSKYEAMQCESALGPNSKFWGELMKVFQAHDMDTQSISNSIASDGEGVKMSETPAVPPVLDKPLAEVVDSKRGTPENVKISWSPLAGDAMKSYNIELSNDGRSSIGEKIVVEGNKQSIIISRDKLPRVLGIGKRLYARVSATDMYKQEGPFSAWSETSFIINLPRPPLILSSARQMGDSASMVLSWSLEEPNSTLSEIQEFEVMWRANMSMFEDGYQRDVGEGGSRLISLAVALSGGSYDEPAPITGGLVMRKRVFETVRVDGFKKRPFHIKVRGRNRRGWSEWSASTGAIAVTCRDDEYLTTNLAIQDWHCEPCPPGATCLGMPFETIYSKPGFWRLPWNGTLFAECKYKERACLGGENTTFPLASNQSTCSEKYKGIACEGCADGYSYSKLAIGCEKCIGGSGSQALLAMGFISALFSLFVGTQVTIASNAKVEAKDSTDPVALFKIMLGHVQITSIASTFNLRWPPVVLALMGFFSLASSATTSVFDIGCHLAKGPDAAHPFYQRTILIAVGPFIGTGMCGMVVAIALTAKNFVKKIDGNTRKQFAVCWLLMLFLSHPVVTQSCFKMFTCRKLNPADSREFLTADATLECGTESFNYWLTMLGLPMLILFSIGIPVLAYVILWRRRDTLQLPETRAFFYFLYAGLNLKYWYWETVLIPLRKVAFIGISVFFSQQGADIAAYAAIILLFAARTAHVAARPYNSDRLVRIERFALTTEFFTFLLGVYLYSPNSPPSLYEAVTILIMGINIFFCIYFLRVALVVAREEVSWCQSKDQKAKRKREAEEMQQELIRLTFQRRSRLSAMDGGDLGLAADSVNLDIKSNDLYTPGESGGKSSGKKKNSKKGKKKGKKNGKSDTKNDKKKKGRASAMGSMWKSKNKNTKPSDNPGIEMLETDTNKGSRQRRDSLNPLNVLMEEKQDDANVFLDEASGRKYGIDASGNTYWLPEKATPIDGDNSELRLEVANTVAIGTKRVTVDTAPTMSGNPIYTGNSSEKVSADIELKMLSAFKTSKTVPKEFAQRRLSVVDDVAVVEVAAKAEVLFDDNSGKYYKVFANGKSEWLDGEIYPDQASGKFYRVLQDGTTEWVN